MRTEGIEFPRGLVLAKPIGQESYDESVVRSLEKGGRLIIQRKHDGYKLIAIKGSDELFRIWTVGGRPMHGRLPHAVSYLAGRPIPTGTVLVGEGLMYENGSERYEWTAKVFQGGDEKSLAVQKIHGPAVIRIFQAFDLPELANSDRRTGRPYQETLAWLRDRVGTGHPPVSAAQTIYAEYDFAKELAAQNGWEGLVLTDSFYRLAWRLDGGSEPRPPGCYKYKPLTEDDFIVTSRGRIWHDDGRLKEVVLSQYDPVSGALFSCGKLGTFSREVREKLSVKRLRTKVLQVAFERRNPDTGKLRFARFMRFREDKDAKACIAPGSYPEAEAS